MPEAVKETVDCPRCGNTMSVRENTTTFWEKQKERYAYYCSNTNCMHKEPLRKEDIDLMRIEQSLIKWEIDLETIEQEILEKYEIKELLRCLRKTLHYLRKGSGHLSAKDYFFQELTNPGQSKRLPFRFKYMVIPMLLMAATIISISWLAPQLGSMLDASLLSLLH
ncbi:MAG: hypothetical protein HY817_01290 [Candidatus Abawacabacteria bacterium]|nr:hypothetical protein [Candidatus Abawacabacteria bacterium]